MMPALWQVSSEVVVPSGSCSDLFFLCMLTTEPSDMFLILVPVSCPSLLVFMGQNGHFSPQFEY